MIKDELNVKEHIKSSHEIKCNICEEKIVEKSVLDKQILSKHPDPAENTQKENIGSKTKQEKKDSDICLECNKKEVNYKCVDYKGSYCTTCKDYTQHLDWEKEKFLLKFESDKFVCQSCMKLRCKEIIKTYEMKKSKN